MLRVSGTWLAAVLILSGGTMGQAQAVAPAGTASGVAPAGVAGSGDRGAGQPAAAAPVSSAPHVPADTRTVKQRALAMETERLFDMAMELKAEVDKTNKNILSLKVVQKAEEIEAMAKGIRTQAKK